MREREKDERERGRKEREREGEKMREREGERRERGREKREREKGRQNEERLLYLLFLWKICISCLWTSGACILQSPRLPYIHTPIVNQCHMVSIPFSLEA